MAVVLSGGASLYGGAFVGGLIPVALCMLAVLCACSVVVLFVILCAARM